ncbi:hypothetical protein RFI_27538 [Reticulomyxa filosa]|uniref:Uncharacterized protein n=1 Tax=Reticulomyxa filosa TaxID=46433 RepID=X6M7D0_RETFI|nr:hypothetical protein RFI_27538 [Reticulomyxa filosa]|eukprot:ETO09839.1 hypothetical protein RFI_27538 [Reticulomyxa filosa]
MTSIKKLGFFKKKGITDGNPKKKKKNLFKMYVYKWKKLAKCSGSKGLPKFPSNGQIYCPCTSKKPQEIAKELQVYFNEWIYRYGITNLSGESSLITEFEILLNILPHQCVRFGDVPMVMHNFVKKKKVELFFQSQKWMGTGIPRPKRRDSWTLHNGLWRARMFEMVVGVAFESEDVANDPRRAFVDALFAIAFSVPSTDKVRTKAQK